MFSFVPFNVMLASLTGYLPTIRLISDMMFYVVLFFVSHFLFWLKRFPEEIAILSVGFLVPLAISFWFCLCCCRFVLLLLFLWMFSFYLNMVVLSLEEINTDRFCGWKTHFPSIPLLGSCMQKYWLIKLLRYAWSCSHKFQVQIL